MGALKRVLLNGYYEQFNPRAPEFKVYTNTPLFFIRESGSNLNQSLYSKIDSLIAYREGFEEHM